MEKNISWAYSDVLTTLNSAKASEEPGAVPPPRVAAAAREAVAARRHGVRRVL